MIRTNREWALLASYLLLTGHAVAADIVISQVGDNPLLSVPAVVAPGEVTTVRVSGLPLLPPDPRFGYSVGDGLRTDELAGVSVRFHVWPLGRAEPLGEPIRSYAIPVVSIVQRQSCVVRVDDAACNMTLITVQIPFDSAFLDAALSGEYPFGLTVAHGGRDSRPFRIFRQFVNTRVMSRFAPSPYEFLGNRYPVFWDSAGREIPFPSRLGSGEELSMIAYGLGWTIPAAPDGLVPEGEFRPRIPFEIAYTFRTDANGGSRTRPASGVIEPISIRLIPGSIGKYQVVFRLPEQPPGIAECLPRFRPQVYNLILTFRPVGAYAIDPFTGYSAETIPVCMIPSRQQPTGSSRGSRLSR